MVQQNSRLFVLWMTRHWYHNWLTSRLTSQLGSFMMRPSLDSLVIYMVLHMHYSLILSLGIGNEKSYLA